MTRRSSMLLALLAFLLLPRVAHADAPACRYTYPASGAVYDTRTKLTWQQAVDANTYTQAEALSYCSGITLASGGWRLPKVSELLTIVDATKSNPSIDATAFPSAPAETFWSSSPYVGSSGSAWGVYFAAGAPGSYGTTNAYRVRCVR